MSANLRLATPADIPALSALLSVLFAQEADFQPDPAKQAAGLELLFARQLGDILLAEADGAVRGMVSLLYTVSTALGGPVAWLEDMVIDPAWRNAGLGGLLLDAALAHAQQQGCLRVTLLTDADNHAAQRFYQGRGFSPSAMQPWRQVFAAPPAPHPENG